MISGLDISVNMDKLTKSIFVILLKIGSKDFNFSFIMYHITQLLWSFKNLFAVIIIFFLALWKDLKCLMYVCNNEKIRNSDWLLFTN